MPRLLVINGRAAVRALERAGFRLTRVRGSHHMMQHNGPPARKVIVPVHSGQDVPPGTLRGIIAEAGLTVEGFTALLR